MNKTNLKDVKCRIKMMIHDKGITQKKLAEYMGLNQSYVSKILNPNNTVPISLSAFIKLSELLNCTIDFLLTGVVCERKKAPINEKEACEILMELLKKKKILISNIKSEVSVRFDSSGIASFFANYNSLEKLHADGVIDDYLFKIMIDSLMEKLSTEKF